MIDKYEYQYMYLQGLKKELQAKGYIATKYFRKDEIDNIIVDSLRYFCKEFEKWLVNRVFRLMFRKTSFKTPGNLIKSRA